MNCQRFEDVVIDVAREQIMDAALQHEALRHGRDCAACASRLNDERALTHQLKELALTTKSVSASEKVEAELLRAFDSQTFVAMQPTRHVSRRYWLAAIAAVVLIACGLFIARPWQSPPPQQANVKQERPDADKKHLAEVSFKPSEKEDRNQQPRANRPRSITYRKQRGLSPASETLASNSVNTEITTDFLPVNYGGAANLDAGGQIVRVEVPRTTMASFGLPVNMERADERIKADVLLGVDGLAHAIRFVGNKKSLNIPK